MATTTRKTPIKYRRGKPIPQLRHGDVIDWTTFPLGSKPNGRRIGLCPKCGRKGEQTHYAGNYSTRMAGQVGGATNYAHRTRFETIFMMVTDSCYIPDVESAAVTA